jgi:uncharacterized phage-associated protein
MQMIPLAKLKVLLLYFGNNTDQRFLGKTKLMKLFYFLDFMHVKKYGAPVTFDTYYNLEHGPIPSAIKSLVDAAEDDIDNALLADTIQIKQTPGQEIHRVQALRPLTDRDMDLLSDSEQEILEKVVTRFGGVNTKAIERASHDEAPWAKTQELDQISYAMAAQDPDCLVTEEEIELLLSV